MTDKCLNHPTAPTYQGTCVGCQLDLNESKTDDYLELINQLREGLQEIFALCGEDENVSRIASPLIDLSRRI